jgi:predicted kinase
MRRRGKRGPNTSESTGKIGQELPQGQLAPLRPSYGDAPDPVTDAARPEAKAVAKPAAQKPVAQRPVARPAARKPTLDGPQGRFQDANPWNRDEPNEAHDPFHLNDIGDPTGLDEEGYGDGKDGDGEDGDFGAGDFGAGADYSGEFASALEEPTGSLVHETQPDSPSVPPPAAQGASPRAPRGFVVLTIGLPGSGKTTWFKRRAVQPLSSDMLRSILFDDITEQRYQGLVFSTLRSLLRARLIAKMPWNYVDATNLSPHERRQWIKMAKSFGYDVHAVFFDVPFDVCMERNRKRERMVAEDVMQKMAERLRPPSFKEGFSKITVVRVKGSVPTGSVAQADAGDAGAESPE